MYNRIIHHCSRPVMRMFCIYALHYATHNGTVYYKLRCVRSIRPHARIKETEPSKQIAMVQGERLSVLHSSSRMVVYQNPLLFPALNQDAALQPFLVLLRGGEARNGHLQNVAVSMTLYVGTFMSALSGTISAMTLL